MKGKGHIQSFRKFKENLNPDEIDDPIPANIPDGLYRSIKKYYETFLINWLDENDPDRDFGLTINQEDFNEEFIKDCIDMFGENGTEEYNSGYDNEIVEKVSRQVLDEEE